MSGPSRRQWTKTDTTVLLAGVLVAVALIWSLMPTLVHPAFLQDMTRVEALNHGMLTYSDTNNGYFPGLDAQGDLDTPLVEHRYQKLLDGGYTVGDVIVSQYETLTEWTTGAVTSANYSYAMLQLPDAGGRRSEWNNNGSADSVVISGRNTGQDAHSGVRSIQTNAIGSWQGPVGWADGHVTQEGDQFIDTMYAPDTPRNMDDNLFEPLGNDDAYMIYTGN